MKKTLIVMGLVALMGASVAVACGGNPNCGACSAKAAKTVGSCKGCGEVKGSSKCCKPAAKCAACSLHKGSPGCAAACKK